MWWKMDNKDILTTCVWVCDFLGVSGLIRMQEKALEKDKNNHSYFKIKQMTENVT